VNNHQEIISYDEYSNSLDSINYVELIELS